MQLCFSDFYSGRACVCQCASSLHGAPGPVQVLRPQRPGGRQGGQVCWRQQQDIGKVS